MIAVLESVLLAAPVSPLFEREGYGTITMGGASPGDEAQASLPLPLPTGNSWSTVMRKKPKGVSSASATSAKVRNVAVNNEESKSKVPPGTATPSSPTKKPTKLKKLTVPSGNRDFNFLRDHLRTGTDPNLIVEAITKLRQKACNRRFAAFEARQATQPSDETELRTSREEWDRTLRVPRSHSGYNRIWSVGTSEDSNALIDIISDSIFREKISQYELDQRLMACELALSPAADATASDKVELHQEESKRPSYLDAVNGSSPLKETKSNDDLSSELKALYELCTTPSRPTAKLREMTSNEVRAVNLIMEGKLEVPAVPTFLINVLSKADLAAFESIFEVQTEYALYGFLPLDFTLHRDCSYTKLVELIQNGRSKSGQTKDQTKVVIAAAVKIICTEQQRLLTFVFPCKRASQAWVGWKLPFGNGKIDLHDYTSESNSTDEHGLNPLVRLDSYELIVNVLHREMKHEELLHVLDTIMRVPVHNMQRAVNEQGTVDSNLSVTFVLLRVLQRQMDSQNYN